MNPEILGLVSSVVILLGGVMQSEKRLRYIDAVGSVMMAIYGVLIKAPSVIFLNGAIALAHIYRAIRLYKEDKSDKSKT